MSYASKSFPFQNGRIINAAQKIVIVPSDRIMETKVAEIQEMFWRRKASFGKAIPKDSADEGLFKMPGSGDIKLFWWHNGHAVFSLTPCWLATMFSSLSHKLTHVRCAFFNSIACEQKRIYRFCLVLTWGLALRAGSEKNTVAKPSLKNILVRQPGR